MSPNRRCLVSTARGTVALLGCVLLLSGGLTGAAPAASPSSGAQGQNARIEHLHDAIEAAFQRCDSSLLKGSFSPRVKTLLSSRALGIRQGYYGADQVLVILQRGFEGRITLRFRLDRPGGAEEDRRRVLPALWRYRDAGASRTEAHLSFTLAPEGTGWFIREIRETQ
jgi:hypothetical protein